MNTQTWSRLLQGIQSRDHQTGGPHASVQWKGTDICADIHCECGRMGHVDGDEARFYECIGCGRRFALGTTICMIPLTSAEAGLIEQEFGFYKETA